MPLADMVIDTGTNEDWLDSIMYVVTDGSADPPQLDLRGIAFTMEVRRNPDDHEVIIRASTATGELVIGPYPDFGWLVINVPHDTMKTKFAGAYVGDIIADDGNFQRRCITFDLNIIEGITRP